MSLMNVGVSALNANQQALTTVGHNIANVNTPGYSRQTVYTNALHGQNMGNGFIGKGVQVATVMRNYSALLNRQSNAANAIHAADTSRLQGLMQMQDVFKGGDGSLGAAVTNMMNAFVDVQAAPSDATGRNVVLTRMSELAARFHAASNMLEEQDYSTAQQLRNNALLVNDKASQVARLNNEISRALATGHQPNDLLDARDQVIREINQYVQTTQVAADDGSISLFVGGSQALVLGINSGQLSVEETKEYPGSQRMALYFSQPGGQQLELTAAMVGGGEIAGLLKFRNEDLAEGRNLLGRLAMTIGHELNLQNQRGLTLNGQQGGALFALPTTSTGYGNITGYSNIGPGAATTQVMDASQLKPSEYRLIFEGSPVAPVLTRMSDGKVFNGSSTPPLTMAALNAGFDADGLRFTVPNATTAAAVAGNSMLFKPFSTAASEIEALVHNPDELAAASALTANINKNNTGKLQLTQLGANDFTGIPAAQDPVRLTFDGAGQVTYQIYDHLSSTWSAASASMDYTPGQPITINGWSITLTGTPAAGDTVDVANALDFGEAFRLNAGNAGAFLDLRDKKVFDEGTTLSDGFSAAMAVVGTRTQSVQLAEKLSSTVAKNLEMDRTAVSGVNLDEEAARLLQYQQAYQASSKVIQIAQSLFDSVLNAVGR
ncbi:flagellar hook-associated protein FlgK [Comamonas denitrificans]|uniref:Flagellar hook-associated protein 1 n=1 Tax=Comamonas denitrificans TaxID=117506 RepID=A0A939H1S0_9BURK|nr:flagellar hook-associated protein FlgK [Comamonas denitrificans]MBO1250783.1 flagellar hook-associated protein FlgK [Comamonas denitrificans]